LKRRGSAYTLLAAGFSVFIVIGIIWGALAFAQSDFQTIAQAQYPYGVYNITVLQLINFGMFAMPFIMFGSIIVMAIIATQRDKRGDF
jgi:uncharacterized membrane protein